MYCSVFIYIYFSVQIFQQILSNRGIYLNDYQSSIVNIILAVIGYIFSFFPVQKISFISYLGNFFAFYITILILIQMKSYYESYINPPQVEYFKIDLNIFTNIAIGFFGYVNHFALHAIFKPVKNSTKLGLYTMVIRSSYLPLFLYTFVAYGGCISFGKDTPNFIILRPGLDGSSDIFMLIGQFGVFLVIIFGLIVRVRCLSENTIAIMAENNFVQLDSSGKAKLYIQALVLLVFSSTTLFLSFLIGDNVLDVISLFSSITCTYYIIICPSNNNFQVISIL